LGNFDGTYDVESQLELAQTLLLEIVVHGALEVAIGEVLLVGNALVKGIVVGGLERNITKIHQDDEPLLLARDATHLADTARSQALYTAGVALLATYRGAGLDGLNVNNGEILLSLCLMIGLAILSEPVMTMFVAHKTS